MGGGKSPVFVIKLAFRAAILCCQCRYNNHFVTTCACLCGGVYVSNIKRKTRDQNDLKLGIVFSTFSTHQQSVDAYWFWVQKVRGTGSSFQTFGTPSHLWNRCNYKVRILYTNAIWTVIACESNIMPERVGCQQNNSCEKFTPTYIMHYQMKT